jgi:hypothetical protein
LCLLTSLTLTFSPAQAQEQALDVVDAFEPVDASASAFHNEKFREAEQALLEGLSRQDNAGLAIAKDKANIHPVSVRSGGTALQEAPKLREAASSPQRTPTLQQASLNEDTKIAKVAKQPAVEERPTAEREAAPVRPVATKDRAPQTKARPEAQPAKLAPPPAQSRLVDNEAELRDLRRELTDTKSALAAAEVEISRLSAIIQDASRARISLGGSAGSSAVIAPKKAAEPVALKQVQPQKSMRDSAPQVAADPAGDLQVATIAVDKADLRLGPGRNHSALMSLRRGSRLAVEARQGEWYRVFAPNGQRAWIHSSLVRFGDGAASLNDGSSVKVRGYDSKLQ